MTTREAIRREERIARERARAGQRLAREAAARRRTFIAAAIRETAQLGRETGCRCELHAGMDDAALRALGGGCTDPRYVCPRLDALRRRVGR